MQAMYFYVRDLLLEELESRRERDDGGADLTDDAHGDNFMEIIWLRSAC